MTEIFLTFIGAGVGGVLRLVLGSIVYSFTGRNFPYGTLVINLTGSFIIGFLYVLITQKYENFLPQLTALLLVGLMGGYTTFSSFSIETLNLIQDGKLIYALANILISTIFGIILAYLGIMLANYLLIK